MRVELLTDCGAEVGERLRAVLDAQLERICRRVPDDAEITVELRVESGAEWTATPVQRIAA